MSHVCKCRTNSVRRNLITEAHVVVSECTVCNRVVACKFYVIMFSHIIWGRAFLTSKHSARYGLDSGFCDFRLTYLLLLDYEVNSRP